MTEGIAKILKIFFLFFIAFTTISYCGSEKPKLVQEYKQKIINNNWSNETIALTLATIQIGIKHNKNLNLLNKIKYNKNLKPCLGAICINTKFVSDRETDKLTNSFNFKKCLKTGDVDSFFRFLANNSENHRHLWRGR